MKSAEHYDPNHPHWRFVEESKKSSQSREWKATKWTHGQDWIMSQPISKDGTFCGTPVPTRHQRRSLEKYVPSNVKEEQNVINRVILK